MLTTRTIKEITGRPWMRALLLAGFVLSCAAVILLTRDQLIDQFTAVMQYPCLMTVWGWILALRLSLLHISDLRQGFLWRFTPNEAGPVSFYLAYRLSGVILYLIAQILWMSAALIFGLWPLSVLAAGLYRMALPWDTVISLTLFLSAALKRRRSVVPLTILFGLCLMWLSGWFISPELFGEGLYGAVRLLPSEQIVLWARSFIPGRAPLTDPVLLPVYDALFTLAGLLMAVREGKSGLKGGRRA
ncbi:MAG: hypothetical protein IJR97_09215 [Clostridia bacterium]|nr:hypothetical protein [Clostridia bacterium]